MRRGGDIRPMTAAVVMFCGVWAASPGQPPEEPWVFDIVRLTSGTEFRGLIEKESPTQISFTAVQRQPGRPTVFFPTVFAKHEVSKVTRLSTAQREQLDLRIKNLRNEPESRKSRLKQLDLKRIDWDKKPNTGWRYESDWFVLESNSREYTVRQVAVRLEEIFASFGRFIAPKPVGGATTTIRVFRSCDEYRQLLRQEGRQFDNAGYYETSRRLVVCSSDLESLAAKMAVVKKNHQKTIADNKQKETELKKHYKGTELSRHLRPMQDFRRDAEQAEKKNQLMFADSERNLFSLLAHEAFHAYVDTGADLPPKSQLPRWLNEGLAQVFESAIMEGGELRLGHADPKRLERIKLMLRRRELLPLTDVLRTRPEQFCDDHANRAGQAEQRYLTAWALSMYLTFDRQLVGGRDFKAYLQSLAQGKDAEDSFNQWVGGKLGAVERDWLDYIAALQTDGSRAQLQGGK